MAVRATEFGLASEDTFTPELQGCDPSYDVLEDDEVHVHVPQLEQTIDTIEFPLGADENEAATPYATGSPFSPCGDQSVPKLGNRRNTKTATVVDMWQRLFGDSALNSGLGGLFAKDNLPINVAIGHSFVVDAMEGRLSNGRGSLFFAPLWKQACFCINVDVRWLKLLAITTILYMLITAWEPIGSEDGDPWPLVVEAFIIMLFITDVSLKIAYVTWDRYRVKRQHQTLMLFVGMYAIDYFLHLCFRGSGEYVRFSRPFRPAFILVRHRELRRILDGLIRMLPDLTALFAGLAAYITFFAVLGVALFSEQYNTYQSPSSAEEYPIPGAFDNVGVAFLRLYVLFSTENYPEIALPAYDHNQWSISYFVIYIYFGVFFLQSLLLAIIVAVYLDSAGKTVASERKKEWRALVTAFKALANKENGHIDRETWSQLMHTLKPSASEDEIQFKFDLLDRESQGFIDCLDFLDMREITQLELRKVNDDSKSCKINNVFIRAVKQINESNVGTLFSSGLILANTFVACANYRGRTNETAQYLLVVNMALYSLMVLGSCLRGLALGRRRYTASRYNCLDFGVLCIAGPLLIIALYNIHAEIVGTTANLLLFARLAWNLNSGRMLLSMLQRVAPPMLYMSVLVCCALFFFAVVGLEFFHGRSPAAPEDAYYFEYRGCNLGFESMKCAVFALFQMITTSNWHEIMNSTMAVYGIGAAVYFCLFYLLVILVLMNLMVAVTIEAFLSARKEMKATVKYKHEKESFITFGSEASCGADSEPSTPELKRETIKRHSQRSRSPNSIPHTVISSTPPSYEYPPTSPREDSVRMSKTPTESPQKNNLLQPLFIRRKPHPSGPQHGSLAVPMAPAYEPPPQDTENVDPADNTGVDADRMYKVDADALSALDASDIRVMSKAVKSDVSELAKSKIKRGNDRSVKAKLHKLGSEKGGQRTSLGQDPRTRASTRVDTRHSRPAVVPK